MTPSHLTITEKSLILLQDGNSRELDLYSPEAFNILSELWLKVGWHLRYSYAYTWLGRPIIQLPEDVLRIQELIYQLQPDIIVETGIAHGGSLIFYASLCQLIGKGKVIGVDIEIRPHNRAAIEQHSLFPYITLIEGDSAASATVEQVRTLIQPQHRVMVILDSNHSHDHVFNELNAYAPLVTAGSYLVATDGIMKDLVDVPRGNPDWKWDNPQQAVEEFLSHHPEFELHPPSAPFDERDVHSELTYWPNAYLKRVH